MSGEMENTHPGPCALLIALLSLPTREVTQAHTIDPGTITFLIYRRTKEADTVSECLTTLQKHQCRIVGPVYIEGENKEQRSGTRGKKMVTIKQLVKRDRFTFSISTFFIWGSMRSQFIFSNVNTPQPGTVRSPPTAFYPGHTGVCACSR